MSATILVVDDLEQNVKLLEAKLMNEYYMVLSANSGQEALDILAHNKIDIILLDVMMPGMDGFETCRRIKQNPHTRHIPVVMVTALTDVEDRIKGLEAGADEFLKKPINDTALFARIKSLARMKNVIEELKLRNKINKEFGETLENIEDSFASSKIIVLDDDIVQAKNIKTSIQPLIPSVKIITNAQDLLANSETEEADLIIISCQLMDDPLRISVQLGSHPKFRHAVLMLLAQEEDMPMVIRSMDLGINDYFLYPVEQSELHARLKTQLKRKIYQDQLRHELEERVNLSTKDSLTGVFNRRYFDVHIKQMIDKVQNSDQQLSLLLLDMDHFKTINDTYGHQAGDEVLKSLGNLLKDSFNITDLIARYGGEEFIVLLGDADLKLSTDIADKACQKIANFSFAIPNQTAPLRVTVSIGVAEYIQGESIESFISRADQALYTAKKHGRNCVISLDE